MFLNRDLVTSKNKKEEQKWEPINQEPQQGRKGGKNAGSRVNCANGQGGNHTA